VEVMNYFLSKVKEYSLVVKVVELMMLTLVVVELCNFHRHFYNSQSILPNVSNLMHGNPMYEENHMNRLGQEGFDVDSQRSTCDLCIMEHLVSSCDRPTK